MDRLSCYSARTLKYAKLVQHVSCHISSSASKSVPKITYPLIQRAMMSPEGLGVAARLSGTLETTAVGMSADLTEAPPLELAVPRALGTRYQTH